MKAAFLFPGQGSQTVGMGRDLYNRFPTAKAVFDEADSALGFPLSELIFKGPEEDLRLTEHTQPAILTVSVAAARVLREQLGDDGFQPAFAAGHSLGEYSAHVVAGTFSFADAVVTVRNRGRYMQEAVPEGDGAMAAILGLDPDRINELCAEASDTNAPANKNPDRAGEEAGAAPAAVDPQAARAAMAQCIVSPANLNSPDQTVISGSRQAVDCAAELCRKAGAKRVVMLPVSAPFHCALMATAQSRLATDLEGFAFTDPNCPVIVNVDAREVTRAADARDCLIRQVTAPVRWVECMRLLIQEGSTPFVEIGPGKVLSGLMRQIDRSQTMLNVEDTASLEKTVAALTTAPQA